LLDVADPEEPFDAARFAELADRAISGVVARGRVPIVVGGTGLWLRALLRGLVDVPKVDPTIRKRLESEWETMGALAMHARLSQLDPKSAARIHVNDRLRVVRALEVFEQTGRPLGDLRAEHALGHPRYRALTCVIDLPLAHHRERVAARVRSMLEEGLIDETQALLERHGDRARALGSVGYAQVVAHLRAGTTLEQVRDEIVRATLVYARRQRTWWKGSADVDLRLTPAEMLTEATRSRIQQHLAQASR
jgi:tRNA dimethylallyltransferase